MNPRMEQSNVPENTAENSSQYHLYDPDAPIDFEVVRSDDFSLRFKGPYRAWIATIHQLNHIASTLKPPSI